MSHLLAESPGRVRRGQSPGLVPGRLATLRALRSGTQPKGCGEQPRPAPGDRHQGQRQREKVQDAETQPETQPTEEENVPRRGSTCHPPKLPRTMSAATSHRRQSRLWIDASLDSNAECLGRTTARRILLLPDGRVLSERALSKVRGDEQGHAYVGCELVRFGRGPGVPVSRGGVAGGRAEGGRRPVDGAPGQPSVRVPGGCAAPAGGGGAAGGGVSEGGWRLSNEAGRHHQLPPIATG
jgi:hypothetical protein